jgi:crossover junction endodeoxyribonuclease RuvC
VRILGIDPGVTGAIAHFLDGKLIEVVDIPFQQEGSRKTRKRINGKALRDLLHNRLDVGWEPVEVYLEQAQSMPGQGVSSTFNYGRTTGIIEGVLFGIGRFNIKKVMPARWKRQLGLIGNTSQKNTDLLKARALYPHAPLELKKHHNRADAILIGHYGCLMEGLLK